jgi:hypothetical protein
MKTIFDKSTRDSLIARIETLNENSTAKWGKMNVYQMLKHGVVCEEMYLGKTKHKRTLLGRLFGKMGLKNLLKDESPIGRNAPTSPAFKIAESSGDVAAEKKKWISLIEEYAHYPDSDLVHWFFGTMTKEQVGYFVYKHTDHHLRQFGA